MFPESIDSPVPGDQFAMLSSASPSSTRGSAFDNMFPSFETRLVLDARGDVRQIVSADGGGPLDDLFCAVSGVKDHGSSTSSCCCNSQKCRNVTSLLCSGDDCARFLDVLSTTTAASHDASVIELVFPLRSALQHSAAATHLKWRIRPSLVDEGSFLCAVVPVSATTQPVSSKPSQPSAASALELRLMADFLADGALDVIRRWDISLDTIIWSPNVESVFGYAMDQLADKDSWLKLVHPDDVFRVVPSLQRARETAGVRFWSEEYLFLRSDGSYATVVDFAYLDRDPSTHQVRQIIFCMSDLMVRSRLQSVLRSPRASLMQDIQGGTGRDSVEELRFQTQIIKTITDNTTSSLFMMDSRGYPTFMNKAAERLTGYTLNEIRDRPLHYAIHYMRPDGSFYPMHECPLDNSSAKLVPMQNQEEVFVDKFGRLFPVMWSVAPLERDGRTVGAVIEFRDVTEEKERERERMEAKVSAEQEEVRRQEAEMHRVRMSEFVDLICHEMRNPLHGIAANNMFLRELINRSHDVSLQEESKDLLSSIEECANHQGRVINSVLELSRLEAGKVELDPSTMSLNTALRNCVDMCRPKFLECKLQCELLLPNGDDVIVHLDSTRLKQIVLNLLTNGIKFTPPNGKITVRLDVTERNSDHVVAEISVEDTGLGMSADEMGMLFKRFSQVNKAVSNKYGGSGLGLSICDQLVRLMHGSIAVNSEKGRGTRFAVRLPCPVPSNASSLAFVAQLATSPVAMSVNSRKAAAGQLADTIKDQAFERILIAEDNPINQRVLAKFLTKLGYAFDLVEDGAQAVQAVCSHDKHYDLVFMDIEMPTMNGLQATRVIREHESRFCQNGDRARCRCVIVALSGNAMKEHMERGREAGMDDYLVKPCRIEEINACIAKWETVVNQERFRTVDVVN